jgi:hypothetical protein
MVIGITEVRKTRKAKSRHGGFKVMAGFGKTARLRVRGSL